MAILGQRRGPMNWFRRFRPTAVLLLTLLPGLAATFSVGLYIARARWTGWLNDGGAQCYVVGTTAAVIAWLALSVIARGLATPAGGNRSAYGRLQEELDDLSALAEHLTPTAGQDPALDAAARTVKSHLERVRSSLGDAGECGRAWVDGTGYVDLWRHLHRAEEALLMLRPAAALIGTAVHDTLRLVGSTIPKRDRLCAELMCAMTALAPEASACFMSIAGPQSPIPLPKRPTRSMQPDGYDLTCRSVLRVVRHAINEYRDDRRAGLVRARNHLFATVAATGLVTYAFLGIAFLLEVPVSAVVAFTAFYLTGAVVGLFRQLQAASVRDTIAEDDFGLSYARLLHAPLFAGLAGVGGVVLTAFASELTVATGNPKAAVPTLSQVFDLSMNQGGLLFAAVFGLTPTLLITRLQSRAESYKADLKSSEPAEQSPSQLATR